MKTFTSNKKYCEQKLLLASQEIPNAGLEYNGDGNNRIMFLDIYTIASEFVTYHIELVETRRNLSGETYKLELSVQTDGTNIFQCDITDIKYDAKSNEVTFYRGITKLFTI